MKSILDPNFRYVNSQSTDLRKTFARIRRQMNATRRTPGDVISNGRVFPITPARRTG